jgi:hypothetical protein
MLKQLPSIGPRVRTGRTGSRSKACVCLFRRHNQEINSGKSKSGVTLPRPFFVRQVQRYLIQQERLTTDLLSTQQPAYDHQPASPSSPTIALAALTPAPVPRSDIAAPRCDGIATVPRRPLLVPPTPGDVLFWLRWRSALGVQRHAVQRWCRGRGSPCRSAGADGGARRCRCRCRCRRRRDRAGAERRQRRPRAVVAGVRQVVDIWGRRGRLHPGGPGRVRPAAEEMQAQVRPAAALVVEQRRRQLASRKEHAEVGPWGLAGLHRAAIRGRPGAGQMPARRARR